MSLVSGTRLGPYEVLHVVGAGGMGEVYRARDTQLDRDVAIKILPAVFALDDERLARFEREAKTLASLNHPHIAQIYGLEPVDGGRALVMELVEGEDLSARIARGPIPFDDALSIARQVAEALEASHERGIIHRDLKPANIKVRDDGTVKVLDFGLAKALDPSGVSGSDLVNSPTITSPATQLGTILGTAAYMAPEQAKGRAIDRRADVWAFGVVLFEMLTGRRAFAGDDVTDLVAAVLKDAVPLDTLPSTTPPAVRRLLRRCLERDRSKRLDSMAAARLEIDEAIGAPVVPDHRTVATSRPVGRIAAIAALASLAGAAIGGAIVWWVTRPSPPPVARLSLVAPEGQQIRIEANHHDVAITRDGSRVAYWTQDEQGSNHLLVRSLTEFNTFVFDGGPSARGMFFSHDGRWIGFQSGMATGAGATLMKMPVAGGAAALITRINANLRSASWGADDTILFATHVQETGLFRVKAAGGDAELITTPNQADGELDHVWPHYLPGGTHALFVIRRTASSDIALLDLRARTWSVIVRDGTMPSYAASGHLVYASAGMLQAVRFDLRNLQVDGTQVRMIEGIVTKESGAADYALSETGTLIYLPGGSVESGLAGLTWIDRQGARQVLPVEARQYRALRVSPDGRRVAVSIEEAAGVVGLWVLDPERTTLTRVTGPGISAFTFAWSPDSRHLAFAGDLAGETGGDGVYLVLASGTTAPEVLVRRQGATRLGVSDFTADGARVIFAAVSEGSVGIEQIDVASKQVTTVLNTPSDEYAGTISPDGRWLAYVSTETGRQEVFVRPFPDVADNKIAVTSSGGRAPAWRGDGRELIVRNLPGDPVSVPVIAGGATLQLGKPTRILEIAGSPPQAPLGVSPDGSRFLIAPRTDRTTEKREYHVVLNWFHELKGRVQ